MYLLCAKAYDELYPIAVFSTTDKIIDYIEEHGLDKFNLKYHTININPDTEQEEFTSGDCDWAYRLWED